MKTIATYTSFNEKRYGNPWVAIINPSTAKIDFSVKVGGYTGRYGTGEAGELYVTNPIDGAVYAFGQKDYRGKSTELRYVKYADGKFTEIEKTELVKALSN